MSSGRAGVQVRVSRRADEAALFGRRAAVAVPPGGRRPPRRRGPRSRDAVRRGRGLRRGHAPAVGQLGGRRGDPRRGHRPVRRPREAALHRLRGRALLGARTVDHPAAAAGPAAGGRAGPPDGAVRAGRPGGRDRLRDPARRRPRRGHRGRDPGGRAGRRPGDDQMRVFGDVVVFLDADPAAAAARKARLDERAGEPFTQRRIGVRRHPGPAGRAGPGLAAGGAGRAAAAARHARPRPAPDHPRAGARAAAPRRVPHRLPADTLRGLLGLPRPANRYAPDGAAR